MTTAATPKEVVPRYWLQATASYPDGAPQREEFEGDAAFYSANLKYEEEWRQQYTCGDADCQNRDCPQHWPITKDPHYLLTKDPLGEGVTVPYPAEPAPYRDQHIELPIAANYVGNWGLWEAVREIWQNALDQGETSGVQSRMDYHMGRIQIASYGVLKPSSLVLGNSTKAGDTTKRGKFGEGYKLALIALLRLGHSVTIRNSDEVWFPRFKHSEQFDTEVLVIQINQTSPPDNDQEVIFKIDGVTQEAWDKLQLNMLDGVTYGILDEPRQKGRVYVGGLYVCTIKDFECGYSFKPDQLKLDRDRGLVSSYDLQNLAAELWAARTTQQSLSRVVELIKSGSNDTGFVHYHTEANSPVVKAVVADFETEHGVAAVAVSSQEEVQRAQAAGVKWVLVPQRIKDIMKLVKNFFIPSTKTPLDRLKDLLESAKWQLSEESKKELADIIRVMEGK